MVSQILLVAEFEKVARSGVHAEHRHEAGLADIEIGRRRIGVEAIAVAHLLAARDDPAGNIARGIVDFGFRGRVVRNVIQPNRPERQPHRVGRVFLRKKGECQVEPFGRHVDSDRAVLGRQFPPLRLLEREHHFDELFVFAGERNGPRFEALRDIGRGHGVADGKTGVVTVPGADAVVDHADRTGRFVGIVDDKDVGIVRNDALSPADPPADIGARFIPVGRFGLRHVMHHAAVAAENVRDVGPPCRVFGETMRRVGDAVHLVDEREVAVGFEAGDDAGAGGKGEEGKKECEFLHGVD